MSIEPTEGELAKLIIQYADDIKRYCDPDSVRAFVKRVNELNEARDRLLRPPAAE